MASRNIVIKNNTRCFKSALQQSLDFSFLAKICTKTCAARAKLFFFANQIFCCFFTVLPRCLRRLALHDFIFCLNKLKILSRASFLAMAKSICYSLLFTTMATVNRLLSPLSLWMRGRCLFISSTFEKRALHRKVGLINLTK